MTVQFKARPNLQLGPRIRGAHAPSQTSVWVVSLECEITGLRNVFIVFVDEMRWKIKTSLRKKPH